MSGERSTTSERAPRGPLVHDTRINRCSPSMQRTSDRRGSGLPVSKTSVALIQLFPPDPQRLTVGLVIPPLFGLLDRSSCCPSLVDVECLYKDVCVSIGADKVEVRRIVVVSIDINLRTAWEGNDLWH